MLNLLTHYLYGNMSAFIRHGTVQTTQKDFISNDVCIESDRSKEKRRTAQEMGVIFMANCVGLQRTETTTTTKDCSLLMRWFIDTQRNNNERGSVKNKCEVHFYC